MKRLSHLTLIFSVFSVFFFLLLIFLRIPFPLYPLMSWQDAIDILTPLVLIPIYWLMFTGVYKDNASQAGEITFMVMAVFWVGGQAGGREKAAKQGFPRISTRFPLFCRQIFLMVLSVKTI